MRRLVAAGQTTLDNYGASRPVAAEISATALAASLCESTGAPVYVSLYDGWTVTGWPITTIRRGEIVHDAGRVRGSAGSGRLIARSAWET